MSALSDDEKRRYARHILINEIGEAGQARLKDARVLVIGAGGLGASALSYLAASGIGHISIVDDDVVELSNLNRQIIHETGDIGRPKVQSAADRISELNPVVQVTPHIARFSTENAETLIAGHDIVVDGCDNFETRYVLNHACRIAQIPWVYAAVRGFDAQISCFTPYGDNPTPCYQCLVPDAPPNRNDCAEHGVLGALVGVMGSMLAIETIKTVLGIGRNYQHRLARYNALSSEWRESRLTADPECKECGASWR